MTNDKSDSPAAFGNASLKNKLNICFLGFFILLFIYFSVMTFKAFGIPPTFKEEMLKESTRQSISYDYMVYPSPSTLYPSGTEPLPSGEKSYFANITQKIVFEVAGEIEVFSSKEPEGDFQIGLFLRSPEQWEKKMDFAPEITVNRPSKEKLEFKAGFTLPLGQAELMGETIVEELGIRPRDAYNLVIQSRIDNLSPAVGDVSNDIPLIGEYTFALKGRIIEPMGQLLYEKEGASKETVTRINYIDFLGYSLEVILARMLIASLLIVSLLGIGFFYLIRRKTSVGSAVSLEVKELERINRRYASRIIKVGKMKEIPENSLVIEVDNFKELVKIANEREKPILQVNSQKQFTLNPNPNLNPNSVRFYIVDEDTLYFYKILNVAV